MSYANQALSMIERNEAADFSPQKYSQKAQKSVKRNAAPGTAIVKTTKGILLEKKPRVSRATTTQ